MDRRIVKLMRDPFIADLGKGGGWWFVEPTTGDILFGSAVLHAWRGLAFSLVPGPVSCGLWLQYADSKFEIGSTDEAEADSWVEAVNAFLASKCRGSGIATAPISDTANAVGREAMTQPN